MAIAVFPLSNSINFVRLEDYALFLQSDNTRLYYDFIYPDIYQSCYFTKIKPSDGFWFQFYTDYENISGVAIDDEGNETVITLIKINNNDDGTFQYELNYDTVPFLGYYYFKLSFIDAGKPILTYQSEWINFTENITNGLKIEWMMDSFPTYPDGIIWGGYSQKIWLEGRISDLVTGSNKSVYETATNSLITTKASPYKQKKLQLEPIPDYLVEKLNIALDHSVFKINQVRYNSDEGLESSDRLGQSLEYPIVATLRLISDAKGQGYENYTNNVELTGELPVIEDAYLMINDTDYFLINDSGDRLKISGT